MADGSLVYPKRGKPPNLLPGYDRDPGNPYRLVKGFEPCALRSIKHLYNKACGCVIEGAVCQIHNDLPVNAYFCSSCNYRRETVEVFTAEFPLLSVPEMRQIPETITLAGKGPSLDCVDWSRLPEFRVAVNEAAYVVPDCTVATAIDSVVLAKYAAVLPKVKYYLLPKGSKAFKFFNTLYYDEKNMGTAASALSVLAELGARNISLVGFDGVKTFNWTYAPSLELSNPPVYSYAKHRQDLLNVVEEFNLNVKWELG